MYNKKLSKPLLALAAVASLGAGFGVAALASADTTGAAVSTPAAFMQPHEKPAAFGKITAISGTTLTLESKTRESSTVMTYTVDAASAKIVTGFANGAETTGTLANLKTGDMIAVEGATSGTTITATKIMTGMPGRGHGMGKGMMGEHGAAGTVTAVSGNTVTITTKDGKTYTVDASSAKIEKMTSVSVADIHVGDTLGAQGSVNGTTVAAQHIMLGMPMMHPGDN